MSKKKTTKTYAKLSSEEAFNGLGVRDMTAHLRMFNNLVRDELFKNVSYSKKADLIKEMKKYFVTKEHIKDGQKKLIFVPKKNINLKINISDDKLADMFHKVSKYPMVQKPFKVSDKNFKIAPKELTKVKEPKKEPKKEEPKKKLKLKGKPIDQYIKDKQKNKEKNYEGLKLLVKNDAKLKKLVTRVDGLTPEAKKEKYSRIVGLSTANTYIKSNIPIAFDKGDGNFYILKTIYSKMKINKKKK